MNKDQAAKKIGDLVERFSEQYESYKSAYNETQTRRDFIDPFFKALGWDIDNENGYAEAYREVIHEDKVKIGKATKAPDYSFRLVGGKRLFFVEAKKPSVLVKDEILPAYQVRRYGWSAKLPISIITDFEEFAVYDCTKKPSTNDKASVARIKYLTYKDYLKEFDFIWDTFSKERVLKGSFDKFIKTDTSKRGTASVDKDFLESLDHWRTILATDICKNNLKLDEDEINYVVQQTIDRLIFLRNAEDRSVEPYGRLRDSIKHGVYYNNLFRLFREADDKYNSGLFDFEKDVLSETIILDNKVIKTIISQLYYPESPYEFSVLPVEILGNAYEQFLGKQIKINANHKPEIKEKPEVRKAGGVYYTPEYIVNYIVKKTVGELIKGKKPTDVAKIKIVDPACGSGSFLIGAYQFLLEWHKNYYHEHGEPKGKKNSVITPDGYLTTAEKKRILTNNIYGVDIDINAVEVTKLSLLLKCMEGETDASISTQMRLFNDRVLPSLDNNIKSGNSLIDTDFYDTELNFGDERTIKPFNWERAFPEVFDRGKFNIVIGNPPWGAEFSQEAIPYIKINYLSAREGTFDSYAIFVEKSLRILKKGGLLGFIIPDTFLRKDDYQAFRELILDRCKLKELIETGPVFSQVRDTWCSVICIENDLPKNSTITHKKLSRLIVSVEDRLQRFGEQKWDQTASVPQSLWQKKQRKIVGYKATVEEQNLIEKIEKGSPLGELKEYKISRGEEGSKFNIKESDKGDYRMVIPENIEKYFVGEGKSILSKSLTPGKVQTIYSHPKIWIIRIQKMRWIQRIVSGLDIRTNTAGMKTLQSIVSVNDKIDDLLYLQAILSSRLMNFWCINYLADDINQSYLSKIPVKMAITKIEIEIRDQIIKDVRSLMTILIEKSVTRLDSKKEALQNKIGFLEDKINTSIYKLYEIVDPEIQMIEKQESLQE